MIQRALYLILLLAAVVSCKTTPEARRPVTQRSGSFINESIERNKALVAKEEEQIEKLIARDSSNTYIASSNGFWYYYNSKSTDSLNVETPEFGDVVRFDYSVKDLYGTDIYTEGEIPTKRYAIDKEELFQGLREGLKLMKANETVTFIFPSHKAFGYYGDKNKIGTNVPIITQVTLHSITHETNK
ncbi:gliding motility-associated peptidyl-prolyl isomerase GldI [Gillisia sp. M10.2A]|uniref:Peptidyl-prolyl cis-trans isomerase n=1 Tax=Gillisia lutea TaxID=2909668 RepID=A0ABS9EER0_9FLAO|nr:gliding motility-associated peptidyl-prolyl isomerase GldI [Gillisia lutea]MCF4101361.1 gliding motility-associated peptidyl-prolyl isomerase GldI [Gillisia lutea]